MHPFIQSVDIIKGTYVAGAPEGEPMARKPASMYRQLKGPAFTRRKYMGEYQTTEFTNSM